MEKIDLAGLLHDIGKFGVRDEVLMKPGGLTTQEFAEFEIIISSINVTEHEQIKTMISTGNYPASRV